MLVLFFFLEQQCLILDFVDEEKKKVERDNVDNDHYFLCANDKKKCPYLMG
jgi:hypothetical protein